jgi:hypothetical protein
MIDVAQRTGRRVLDVAAEPAALTAWTLLHLQEIEYRATARRRFEEVNTAVLTAFAFNEPKRLKDARDDVQRELCVMPSRDETFAVVGELAREILELDKEDLRRRQAGLPGLWHRADQSLEHIESDIKLWEGTAERHAPSPSSGSE